MSESEDLYSEQEAFIGLLLCALVVALDGKRSAITISDIDYVSIFTAKSKLLNISHDEFKQTIDKMAQILGYGDDDYETLFGASTLYMPSGDDQRESAFVIVADIIYAYGSGFITSKQEDFLVKLKDEFYLYDDDYEKIIDIIKLKNKI